MSDITAALRRELAHYEARGKDDRAEQVRAEIAKAEKSEAAEARAAAVEAPAEEPDKAPRSLRRTKERAVAPVTETAAE